MPYKDKRDPRFLAQKAKHYQDTKEQVIARTRAREERFKLLVQQHKEVPCTDCGVQYPYYVMDFDHVQDDKVDVISRLWRKGNEEALLTELNKCEVVCSNCHRERTHKRAPMV